MWCGGKESDVQHDQNDLLREIVYFTETLTSIELPQPEILLCTQVPIMNI